MIDNSKRNEQSLNHRNTRRKEKAKGEQQLMEEIITKNFPDFWITFTNERDPKRVPNKIDSNKTVPKYIVIKW